MYTAQYQSCQIKMYFCFPQTYNRPSTQNRPMYYGCSMKILNDFFFQVIGWQSNQVLAAGGVLFANLEAITSVPTWSSVPHLLCMEICRDIMYTMPISALSTFFYVSMQRKLFSFIQYLDRFGGVVHSFLSCDMSLGSTSSHSKHQCASTFSLELQYLINFYRLDSICSVFVPKISLTNMFLLYSLLHNCQQISTTIIKKGRISVYC